MEQITNLWNNAPIWLYFLLGVLFLIKMIIVLQTRGKNEYVHNVKIKLFTNMVDAERYCAENTDNPMEEKYWKYCEIIEEGHTYEIVRYPNCP